MKPNRRAKTRPSLNGRDGDGRDERTGRFAPGWKGGPGGNRYSEQLKRNRAVLAGALTADELRAAVRRMHRAVMQSGDVAAFRALLEAVAGRLPVVLATAVVGDEEDPEPDAAYL